MQQLVEMESWAAANLNMMRSRGKDCFHAALKPGNGGKEERFYNMMYIDKRRYEASPALSEQMAKLDRMVRGLGGHSLGGNVIVLAT